MGIYNLIFRSEQDRDEFFVRHVQVHEKEAYRIILRYVEDHQTAEDLTQEALYKAWKNLDQLKERTSSRAWLLQIARNEVLYYLRRRKKLPPPLLLEDYPEKWTEHVPSALEELIRKCDAEIQREAFQQLDADTKVIMWLHLDCKNTFAQIAEIMNVHPKAVASRYYRGRDKVIAYIKKANNLKEK